jgi:hypothetical protein
VHTNQGLAIKDHLAKFTQDFGFQSWDDAEMGSVTSVGDHQELILEAFDPNNGDKTLERLTIEKLVLDKSGARLREAEAINGEHSAISVISGTIRRLCTGFASQSVPPPVRPSECVVVKHREQHPGWTSAGGLNHLDQSD